MRARGNKAVIDRHAVGAGDGQAGWCLTHLPAPLPTPPVLPAVPRVVLVFPEAGPLVRSLPRFLSAALASRLSARGVTVRPYTLLRFVAPASQGSSQGSSQGASAGPAVDVYTCRTFDALDTATVAGATWVAVADYAGCGPSDATGRLVASPAPGSGGRAADGGPWGRQGGGYLEVHELLGGLVVGAELMAASRVWAAGDAAVFPHAAGLGRCRGKGRWMLSAAVACSNGPGWLTLRPTNHGS